MPKRFAPTTPKEIAAMRNVNKNWVEVREYIRQNGTAVESHYRTYPDRILTNNFSYPGNYNPNTGRITKGDPVKYLQRMQNKV